MAEVPTDKVCSLPELGFYSGSRVPCETWWSCTGVRGCLEDLVIAYIYSFSLSFIRQGSLWQRSRWQKPHCKSPLTYKGLLGTHSHTTLKSLITNRENASHIQRKFQWSGTGLLKALMGEDDRANNYHQLWKTTHSAIMSAQYDLFFLSNAVEAARTTASQAGNRH